MKETVTQVDGFNSLLNLLGGEEKLLEHYIESVLFFPQIAVFDQITGLIQSVENKDVLAVRYTGEIKRFFDEKGLKSKKDIYTYCEENEVYHPRYDVPIKLDDDGNTFIRKEIEHFTGHKLSSGKLSTVKNYVVSHIWDNTTDDPYFFSSLWNTILVPTHLSFLLDKGDQELINSLQHLLKAVVIELYSLDEELSDIKDEFLIDESYAQKAKALVAENKINFLPKIKNAKSKKKNSSKNAVPNFRTAMEVQMDICMEYDINLSRCSRNGVQNTEDQTFGFYFIESKRSQSDLYNWIEIKEATMKELQSYDYGFVVLSIKDRGEYLIPVYAYAEIKEKFGSLEGLFAEENRSIISGSTSEHRWICHVYDEHLEIAGKDKKFEIRKNNLADFSLFL